MHPPSSTVWLKLGFGGICLALIAGASWFIASPPEAPLPGSAVPGATSTATPAAAAPFTAGREMAARAPAPSAGSATAAARAASPAALAAGKARAASPGPTVENRAAASSLAAAAIVQPAPQDSASRREADDDPDGEVPPASLNIEIQDTLPQSGPQVPVPVIRPSDAARLAAEATPAEDVPEIGDARQTMEEAQLAADAKIQDPAVPNVVTRNAMDRLVGAFVRERDSEARQDLLASADEIARASGESMQRILSLALQPQQPEEVQQQALYLAARRDPALVRKIAENPAHPLYLEADAFLREARIAAGVPPTITDQPRETESAASR